MSEKPIVGITMGDPAGNGPEITVKALSHADIYDRCRPIVVGDAKMLEQATHFVGRPDIAIHRCEKVSDAKFTPGTIDVLHLELIPDVKTFPIGQVSVEGGNAAFQCVKKARVLEVIEIADKACKDMGIAEPKIAVAGLNPHCGENGLFGTEEIEEIKPAIEAAKAEGINAIGPIPPDSVFSEALGGWYDIVVCMYHDQGHIPLKTVGFVYDREKQAWKAVEGVNVTLGLPIIRTSVDHGTGFALAGKGTSNELSLVNAIDYAIKMTNGRKKQ